MSHVGRVARRIIAVPAAGCVVARRLAAVLLVLLVPFSLPAGAQQLSLQHYGKADGLVNLNPLCLLQDHDGFLWACTENGLFRYDGHRFRRFGEDDGIENTLVYDAVQDPRGRLWLTTSSDLYVGEGGRFRVVRPQGRAIVSASTGGLAVLADGRIGVIVRGELLAVGSDDGGTQWRATPLFSPQQVAQTPALAQITGVHVDADGSLWLGCASAICEIGSAGAGVAPSLLRHWSAAEGVSEDHWLHFLRDAAGNLWARGQHAVLLLPSGAERFEPQDVPDAALHTLGSPSAIAESPDGGIVLRTEHGLASGQRGDWSFWTRTNGLPSIDVSALLFDREGSLWAGVSGQGLVRWRGYERFESWTRAQGLESDAVWGLLRKADGPLLLGTRDGCRALRAKAAAFEPCAIDGLPPGEINSLAQGPDGRLWIGLNGHELLTIDPASTHARRVARLPRFTSMLVDSQQRLWLPTRGGIFLMTPTDTQPRRTGNDHEFLDAAEDAAGGVWIVGADGLQRFADGRWTQAALADRRAGPGFSSVAIGSDGVLWAASRSLGVMRARIDGAALKAPQWIDDPLMAGAAPMFVRIDAAQRVWVGTDVGVVVRDRGADGGRWVRLTESDGLVWNDADFNSFHADADGSVWIGTSNGLSHVVAPARALARPPLQLRVVDVRYADHAVTSGPRQALPWSRTAALDLDLVSFNFSRSVDSVFRYRIAGIDADWFESRSPHVHYPAIEPGSYRFEAVLFDADRRQSSPGVGFDFEVLPPWWRTWWFRAALAVAALAALTAVWRWQLGRLTARHATAQRLAQERHVLLERASRDGLTGLWNRSAILDLLGQAIDRRPPGEPLALAVLDVDHFKRVNDTYGHATGDALLRELSLRLTSHLRQVDLLGRYGGEELLLILPGLPCEAPAGAVERLRQVVADLPFAVGEHVVPVSISLGVAWFGVDPAAPLQQPPGQAVPDTAQRMFEGADAALYQAKRGGRNRVAYALPAHEAAPATAQAAPG